MTKMLGHIKDLFRECNMLYFRNSLPMPEFELMHDSNTIGLMLFEQCKGGRRIIKITDFYVLSEIDIKRVLLHEMCHLFCVENGFYNEGHGMLWKKVVRVVSSLSGLDIPEKIDTTSWVMR